MDIVAQSDDKDGAAMPSGASSDNLKTSYLQLLQEAFALREKLKGRQASAQLELERLHGPIRVHVLWFMVYGLWFMVYDFSFFVNFVCLNVCVCVCVRERER